MARGFEPARLPAGAVPEVQEMVVTASQTFKRGALVVDVSAGTISECGADPTLVYGVALQDAFSGPGNEVANSSQNVFTTGETNVISIAIANRLTIFSARAVNGGTDPVIPLQTHIGEQYGVAKVSNDWVIDIAETTAKVVEIVDIEPPMGALLGFFYVKFLEAVITSR